MKDFQDKVAVVTGAASGIGRAMAERFAAAGMKVVLADIEREALHAAEAEMKAAGRVVLVVRTDVAEGAQVENLARATLDRSAQSTFCATTRESVAAGASAGK